MEKEMFLSRLNHLCDQSETISKLLNLLVIILDDKLFTKEQIVDVIIKIICDLQNGSISVKNLID